VRVQHDFGNALTLHNTTRYGRSSNDYIVTNPDNSAGNVRGGLAYRAPKSRIANTATFVNQTDLSGEFMTGGIRHTFVTGLELGQERATCAAMPCFPMRIIRAMGESAGCPVDRRWQHITAPACLLRIRTTRGRDVLRSILP